MFISLMFRSSYVGVLLIIAERLSDNLSFMPLGVVLGGSIRPHRYTFLKAPVSEYEMFLFSRLGFPMGGVGSLTPPNPSYYDNCAAVLEHLHRFAVNQPASHSCWASGQHQRGLQSEFS